MFIQIYRYLVIFFASVSIVYLQDPRVNTANFGEIVGKEISVKLDSSYTKVHGYLGIPFAKPPIGDLRFRKPEPITSLSTPFSAQNFSAICPRTPSYITLNASQSEDCLYLNIYVPDRPAEIPGGHAVMIWIDGSFTEEGLGSQGYDFSTLSVAGNIIVVTFNYRVGVLGFLSSSDENARGNYGLWDQHMAFQWVHDNIGDFGGNNERVTIAGQSAGAMFVTEHALIPANKGLFQRIIAQSGSILMPFLVLDRNWSQDLHAFAERVGCKLDYMFDIIECLRTKSVDELLETWHVFGQTLDGEFIETNIRDIAKLAETQLLDEVEFFRSLDILSGFNANEGASLLSIIMNYLPKDLQSSQLEDLIINPYDWKDHYIPVVMNFTFQKHFTNEIMQLVEAQYTPWPNPYNYELLRLKFEKLIGDLFFAIPTIQMARLHGMSSSENNFMYHFAPKLSIQAKPELHWIQGAGHSDELMFMMGAFDKLVGDEEIAWGNDLMIKMMTYWSNFVKSGNPNYPEPVTPNWSKYDNEIGEYLLLNKTMTDMPGPRYFYAEEANFWLHVFPDLVAVVTGNKHGNCGYGAITSGASDISFASGIILFTYSMYQCMVLQF